MLLSDSCNSCKSVFLARMSHFSFQICSSRNLNRFLYLVAKLNQIFWITILNQMVVPDLVIHHKLWLSPDFPPWALVTIVVNKKHHCAVFAGTLLLFCLDWLPAQAPSQPLSCSDRRKSTDNELWVFQLLEAVLICQRVSWGAHLGSNGDSFFS